MRTGVVRREEVALWMGVEAPKGHRRVLRVQSSSDFPRSGTVDVPAGTPGMGTPTTPWSSVVVTGTSYPLTGPPMWLLLALLPALFPRVLELSDQAVGG